MTIARSLRNQVFSRDNNQCQKCGANHSLRCQHIKPDDVSPENLITLCIVCQAEWHSLELGVEVMQFTDKYFQEWLSLPPLGRLIPSLQMISTQEFEGLSAREWLTMAKTVNDAMPRFQG